MRRIYLESFIGLLILFASSIFAYEYTIYHLNPDYDYVLQEREAQAYRDIVLNIEQRLGAEQARQTIQNFVDKTAQKVTLFTPQTLPSEVARFFNPHDPTRTMYFDDDRYVWFRLTDPNTIYHVQPDYNTPLRQAIEFDDNIGWGFILAGFFCYSLCFIWFLSRRVRLLEHATVEFSKGDFNARAPIASGKALGNLNRSFNRMADKIARLISGNRFLTNALAHDLRTPIFRIQWQAEMLQEQGLKPQQHQQIASIIEDTEEMERMVDELLYFAKIERPESDLNREAIKLEELLIPIVRRIPNQRDIKIDLQVADNSEISADRSLLTRAIVNLLSNAVRYAMSQVRLTVEQNAFSLIIRFEDDGEGIDPKHWAAIFQPFYTSDAARNKQQSGFGLGLSIVELIAKKHQGKAEVGHSTLGGAQFTLIIPKLSSETDKHET